jgi:hypothetical protein
VGLLRKIGDKITVVKDTTTAAAALAYAAELNQV